MANTWKGYLGCSFLAFQACVVPRAASFTPEQKEKSLELAANALAGRPWSWKWKILAFFILLDIASFFLGGRFFLKLLSPTRKREVLQLFFDSPVPLLRKGFWGISTLAKLGFYGQESVYESLHYFPNREA